MGWFKNVGLELTFTCDTGEGCGIFVVCGGSRCGRELGE